MRRRLYTSSTEWPVFAMPALGKNVLVVAGICCILYSFAYFIAFVVTGSVGFPLVVFLGMRTMTLPFFYALSSICSLAIGIMSIRWRMAIKRALVLMIISIIYIGFTVAAIFLFALRLSTVSFTLELISIPVSILIFAGALMNKVGYNKHREMSQDNSKDEIYEKKISFS